MRIICTYWTSICCLFKIRFTFFITRTITRIMFIRLPLIVKEKTVKTKFVIRMSMTRTFIFSNSMFFFSSSEAKRIIIIRGKKTFSIYFCPLISKYIIRFYFFTTQIYDPIGYTFFNKSCLNCYFIVWIFGYY